LKRENKQFTIFGQKIKKISKEANDFGPKNDQK